jgi:hypothetical protein
VDAATAIAQIDGVSAEVLEHTTLDRDVPRSDGDYRARHVTRSLRVDCVARFGFPNRVGKRHAAKGEMLNKTAGAWNSPEFNQARQSGSDELRAVWRLTVARHVMQCAGR